MNNNWCFERYTCSSLWICFAAKTVFNSFIRRAGTILNQPFVQEHLAILIKEKENLQEALHAKWVKWLTADMIHSVIENYS